MKVVVKTSDTLFKTFLMEHSAVPWSILSKVAAAADEKEDKCKGESRAAGGEK